jgi:murein peptide amidase A
MYACVYFAAGARMHNNQWRSVQQDMTTRHTTGMQHFWGLITTACPSLCRAVVMIALATTSLPTFAAETAAPSRPNPVAISAVQQCLLIGVRLNVTTDAVCDGLRNGTRLGATSHGESVFGFSYGTTGVSSTIRVLVLGAIHGDETSSAWLAFQWLSDPIRAATLPKNFAVRVIPLTNPDSAFARPARRTNANGVDLNRNFPTKDWATASSKWWTETTKRDPRRWPGTAAASELETKLILKEIDTFKPSVIVSVHAPFGVLDFDGPGAPPTRIGSLRLDTVGIYPGSLGNYASQVRGIPVVTLELPAAMKPTSRHESRQMWKDLLAWLQARPKLVSDR